MGWEKRRNGRYYYYKKRVAGRVVSQYCGRGEMAELIAQLHSIDPTQALQDTERAERAADKALDDELRKLGRLIRGVLAAALLAGGHYTHKGQWRRQREPTANGSDASVAG